jgi:glutamyl-tRNA synthetase
VVVDDAAMGVTEILRGDDLLSTTHRQIQLQKALGLPTPAYVHVPLVVGPDGRRLAKRHGDTRIAKLRKQGVAPSRVVGLLAHWCGWAEPDDELMPSDLINHFTLETIPREPITLPENLDFGS